VGVGVGTTTTTTMMMTTTTMTTRRVEASCWCPDLNAEATTVGWRA
jgi:hypothetical protein